MERMLAQVKFNSAQSFCNCTFPEISCYPLKEEILDEIQCRCGENDDLHRLKWTWQQNPESDTLVRGQDVIFHPIYSQGTSGVRGTSELAAGMVHYWEIRMITVLAGTDIMFGVGTDEVSFEPYKFTYVSALGYNTQSWGYSFHGFVQHNHKQRVYGRKFSRGSVLGILLDRTRGHLEYYINRRPLGIAFKNIPIDPTIKLYPFICSTAAKSIVRLINSISEPECLQLNAYRTLSQSPKMMKELQKMPGLRSIVRTYWFFAPEVHTECCNKTKLDLTDEALLSTKRRMRKHKYSENDDENDMEDIYANAHKVFVAAASDSEDESIPSEWIMDEFFNLAT